MPRSLGYRPRNDVRDEVMALRSQLGELTTQHWQQASMIMHQIAVLTGKCNGPSGGSVEPRACKYCGYFGHTRQWCPRREKDDDRKADKLLDADQEYARRVRARVAAMSREPYNVLTSAQAKTFDRLGIPWTVDDDCGAIVAARGDKCYGKWSFA